MKYRIGLIAAAAALCLGMLTGCSGIKDAKSLSEANKTAQEAVKSFHMDSTIDMEMSYSSEALSSLGSTTVDMPMKIELSVDSGRKTAHADTSVDMSLMGQKTSQIAEMYCDIEHDVVYTKAEGQTTWTRTEQDAGMTNAVNSIGSMKDSILEKAEFENRDGEYILTLDAKYMGDAIEDLGMMDTMESSGMEMKNLDITDGTIVYRFDEKTQLIKSMKMDGVTIHAAATVQSLSLDMDIAMDADYKFSKYDKVDKSAYEIPAEVIGGKEETGTAGSAEATTAPASTLPEVETQLTVDGDSTPKDQGWYVVGRDSIPAGTYKIFHGDGQGVLTIKSGTDYSTLGDWMVGYETQDNLTDGARVTVNNGDSVFITKGLAVVFDPVHE